MTTKTRIWYQSMTPFGHLPNYVSALSAHAEKVCSPGVEIRFNGLPEKWFSNYMPGEIFKYAYVKHVIQNEMIDVCRRAEHDGFDAIILGSFGASFLTEIRSVCSVPVVSMAESVLLVSCSLAESITVVCLAPAQVPRIQQVLDRHGIGKRIRSIEALQQPLHEGTLNASFSNPEKIIDEFTEISARAVRNGSDAIIPAEGVLSELLFAHGVTQVDGASVVDVVGVPLLYAEMMLALKRRAGLDAGRRWAYSKPPQDVLNLIDRTRSA